MSGRSPLVIWRRNMSGGVHVVYRRTCFPCASRSKRTVKRKDTVLPFFLFSLMFAMIAPFFPVYQCFCPRFFAVVRFFVRLKKITFAKSAEKATKNLEILRFQGFFLAKDYDNNRISPRGVQTAPGGCTVLFGSINSNLSECFLGNQYCPLVLFNFLDDKKPILFPEMVGLWISFINT